MTRALRYTRWLGIGLWVVMSLACSKEAVTSPAGPAKPGDAEQTERRPQLSTFRVHDETPEAARLPDLKRVVETALKRALWNEDAFARAGDKETGCKAEFTMYYALLRNGEPVKTTRQGEVRMALQGEVHCMRDETVESYRVEVRDKARVDAKTPTNGSVQLKALAVELVRRASQVAYGQVIVRHASDERLLEVLAKDTPEGMVMEASVEAGERKLKRAVPLLLRLTRHPTHVVAMRAAAGLGLIRVRSPEVIQALVAMTKGTDFERHVIAINALGDIGGAAAARYLGILATGHPNEAVRAVAREAKKRSDSR